ncbi:MAG: BrnT family toxin [Thermomicrobiales bacterium]
MRFEWDLRKSQDNLFKHDVSFELAEFVFLDPLNAVIESQIVDGEQRWVAVGFVPTGDVLYVVHTVRESDDHTTIRIISARKASRLERRAYEEGY